MNQQENQKHTQEKLTQEKKKKKMFYEKIYDKYIDPFTDFGFKKLFGEECNKDLLLDFLNELLHQEEGRIVSISYLKTEKLGFTEKSRNAVFDIFCENEKGEKFIVELQKAEQKFFKDRALFYSTFPITQQAPKKKVWNYELKAVYVIAILNFVFDEDKKDPHKYRYDVMLSDIETNKVFYDKLTFIYLEMPKFTKKVDELNTHFEKWLYVIKNLKRLENIPAKLKEHVFENFFAAAEVAKLTEKEYMRYLNNLKANRDWKNIVDTARDKGKAEGRAEGMTEGIIKGMIEGKLERNIEIAQKAIEMGMSIKEVSELTGLSEIVISG